MYTITVKIAANGTIYHNNDTSVTGHMWYSLSDGGTPESYGFAPAKDGMPLWEGTIKTTDNDFLSFPLSEWECIRNYKS